MTLVLVASCTKERDFGEPLASGGGGAGGSSGAPAAAVTSGRDSGGDGEAGRPATEDGGSSAAGAAPGAAGVATAGASMLGDAGQGGADGSPAVTFNPFAKGPCVVLTGGTSIEAFARGSDKKIRRRVLDGGTDDSWKPLTGLDTTALDVRFDLDCSANATSTFLAAAGNQPVGAYLLAVGSGATFNPFVRQLVTSTFEGSVSVSGSMLVGIQNHLPLLADVNGDSVYWLPSPTTNPSLSSTASVTVIGAYNAERTFIAAFTSPSELVVQRHEVTATGTSWTKDPIVVAPPTGLTFEFAPAICATYYPPTGGTTYPSRHLVASAGGKLWYASSSEFDTTFTPWQATGATDIASSPDCTAEADGTVHVVALGALGNVVHVHGKARDFEVEDLGGY